MLSPSFCIHDDALKVLEEAFAVAGPGVDAEQLLELAWHLRQRNGPRAVLLTHRASAQLEASGDTSPSMKGWGLLVQAEVSWHSGDLTSAASALNAALDCFAAARDGIGLCEAHVVSGMMAHEAGDRTRRDVCFETAAMHARLHGDRRRALVAQAAQVGCAMDEGADDDALRIEDVMAELSNSGDDVLRLWAVHCLGGAALATGEYRDATLQATRCWDEARNRGLLRMAGDAARRASLAFAALGDQQGAMEWAQRAIELARELSWPVSLCQATQAAATCLLEFGQWEQANGFIREGRAMAQTVTDPRVRMAEAALVGSVEEAAGSFELALTAWREHEQLCIAHGVLPEHTRALCSQSRVLIALGRLELADTAARSALSIAVMHGNPRAVSAAWRALALVRRAVDPNPSVETSAEQDSTLRCLEQALAAAQTVGRAAVPESLLVEMAEEHKRLGNHAVAYDFLLHAREVARTLHAENVTNLTVALEVRHRTEQAQASAAQNQKLAEQLAARTQELDQTLAQLRESQADLERHAASLGQANRILEELSMIDATTGLRSRLYAERQLAADMSLCVRIHERAAKAGIAPSAADLILFLIDIDRFAWVIESCGPETGNRMLAEVARRLTAAARASDFAVRWEGSKFLVVARHASRTQVAELASRLRTVLSEAPYRDETGVPMRLVCSIGVACFPLVCGRPSLFSRDEVLALLDEGLLVAKRSGPGQCLEARVESAGAGPDSPTEVSWATLN